MSLQVAAHQTDRYRVSTDVYEGPLDLLLELIERAELDITSLAIAQVTDPYLAYLQHLENRDPAEVSAFLVLAARLVQIKSAALLPRPPAVDRSDDEEDDAEALARQLILYKRFKELAAVLSQREAAGLRTYLRISTAVVKLDTRLDLTGITLRDVALAARQVLAHENHAAELSSVVSLPRITIREKIVYIVHRLKAGVKATFTNILIGNSRTEIVVTFLAMLELVKRNVVNARQDNLFGEIELDTIGDLQETEEIELEFKD